MQVGTMVEDRVYGGDTRFRLGVVKTVDECGQIFVYWLDSGTTPTTWR